MVLLNTPATAVVRVPELGDVLRQAKYKADLISQTEGALHITHVMIHITPRLETQEITKSQNSRIAKRCNHK